MPALDELEAAWLDATRDAGVHDASSTRCCATTPVGRRRSTWPSGSARRRAHDLSQARGPAPHRRAQDQQRARPGAARQADGQAARHRRDRRGPARRRDGDRVRAARPRVRRLHGRRGHAPPEARTSSGWACSARRSRRSRPARNAEGGRSAAIRDWVANVATTHYVLGTAAGPAPYPGARARPAARDRRRGARAAARARGPAARTA